MSSATWVAVSSGASGTAKGTVTLLIGANVGAARAGTVTIAGQTFTVSQAAGSGGVSTSLSIFGAGIKSAGVLAADGSTDSHYQLASSADSAYPGPNAVVVNAASIRSAAGGVWLADGPNSKWISPRADRGGNAVGNYTYHTAFDLTGLDPTTAILTGQYAADNSAVIKLNGTTVGPASSGFSSWTSFSLSSGFVAGVNTLDFVVTNGSGFQRRDEPHRTAGRSQRDRFCAGILELHVYAERLRPVRTRDSLYRDRQRDCRVRLRLDCGE